MRRFADLLDYKEGTSPAETQKLAQLKFPDVLREHALALFEPNHAISEKADFLLLGVAAAYSKLDLSLLDEIAPSIARAGQNVAVFDASLFRSHEEFSAVIPGLNWVHHTPVVGLWANGELTAKLQGYEAVALLRDRFGRKE